LPDHDWTGPDEQDFLELVISRHLRSADSKRNQANVTRESSEHSGGWASSLTRPAAFQAAEMAKRQAGSMPAESAKMANLHYAAAILWRSK
jgi:hypothetical protein